MPDRVLFPNHWPHLATKPVIAAALAFGVSRIPGADWRLVVLVALLLPAFVSGIRKQILWPGCFRHAPAWKDEACDLVASSIGAVWWVLPPLGAGLWTAVAVGALLAGLHRWGLP